MKKYDMFMSEFDDRFDCDPCNECDFDRAKELTENQTPQEVNSEHAAEFAAPDKTKDFFNSPGIIAPLGKSASELTQQEGKTDLSSLYDTECGSDCGCDYGCGCGENGSCIDEPTNDYSTETADDCGCGHGCGCDPDNDDNCGCGCGDRSTESAQEYGVDLADHEMAATTDYRTFSAQQRCSLDDYEIISDVLGSEKQLVKLYSTALCESAEESLRSVIRVNLTECANDQYATFEYMEKHGLYPTEEAPEEKIIEAKRQFGPLCK